MSKCHNIWVQYTESDLDNTFQGRVPSFLYYSLAGPRWIRSSNFRSACLPENQYRPFLKGQEESTMDIMSSSSRIYSDDTNKIQRSAWLGWLCWQIYPDCKTDWYDAYYTFEAIVWPVHLVRQNAASDMIDSIWLVNDHVELDTYWTGYQVQFLNQGVEEEDSELNCTIWYTHCNSHSWRVWLQVQDAQEWSWGPGQYSQ